MEGAREGTTPRSCHEWTSSQASVRCLEGAHPKATRARRHVLASFRAIASLTKVTDLATTFYQRGSSTVVSTALRQWRGAYITHRNATTFAAHYHSAQLQYRALLTWRLQLRARLKMIKQARIAQKFFVQQRYFRLWLVRVKEERLEKRRREFEARVTQRYFVGMRFRVVTLCKSLT